MTTGEWETKALVGNYICIVREGAEGDLILVMADCI